MPTDPNGPEKELVRKCLAGDPAAWERLLAPRAPSLKETIRGTLRRYGSFGDAAALEDLVQETAVSLMRDGGAALRAFRWSCSLDHYLASVAIHRALDHLRRSRPGLSLEAPVGAGTLFGDLAPDNKPGPAEASEEAEQRERLRQALAKLPARERVALHLFYWQSLPPRAIARSLRVQPESLWSLLARARAHLRDLLKSSLIF